LQLEKNGPDEGAIFLNYIFLSIIGFFIM
jgi:hypothetical protein